MPDSLPLWHLTERRVWTEALREGAYPWSTRGVSFEDEGFVHCCYPAQVATVARAVYGDALESLVVVEIAREDDRSLFSSPYCTGIISDPRGTGNVSESRSITVDPDTRSTLSSWRSSPDTR